MATISNEKIEFFRELAKNDGFNKSIRYAGQVIAKSLVVNNGKMLVCGNGGSAAQASHFVGEVLGRFLAERPSLPAISLFDSAALTAISNDYGYDKAFSRQIEGLGDKDDVLFVLSTSGNSSNCLTAIETAKRIGMVSIALLGGGGGKIKNLADISIVVPSKKTPLVQEVHIMVIHYLSKQLEKSFEKKL